MVKKSIAAVFTITAFAASLYAEEEKSKVTIDAGVDFVSNYVWRGGDMYAMYAEQNNKAYGSASGAWAMQPSVTVNMPGGLYFNIWGSFALQGRSDADSDKKLQTAPGGSDLLVANGYIKKDAVDFSGLNSPWNLYAAVDPNYALNNPGSKEGLDLLNYLREFGVAGYHKEKNGLRRLDETDFTLGYATSSNFGEFDFGLISYVAAGSAQKDWVSNEIFISYALPFFTDLSFTLYTDIGNANQYYLTSYEKSFEVSKGTEVFFGIGAGYGVQNQLQGWQDVTGKAGVSVSGFTVSYNFAYRPDTRFFDPDEHQDLPYTIFGISSKTDGMVADPRFTAGVINEIFQSEMSAEIGKAIPGYTFVPLQKIPRVLQWVSFGYSTSFE